MSASNIKAYSDHDCTFPSFGEFVLDGEGIRPNCSRCYGFRDTHSNRNALNPARGYEFLSKPFCGTRLNACTPFAIVCSLDSPPLRFPHGPPSLARAIDPWSVRQTRKGDRKCSTNSRLELRTSLAPSPHRLMSRQRKFH